jgi:uncharacterized protein (UPF0262 family)
MTERAVSGRLIAVEIDPASLERGSAEAERELAVAIADLVGDNLFQPAGVPPGRFRLQLARADQRLQLTITSDDGTPAGGASISLVPFRKLVADYFLVCDSYYAALRTATPARIEAIDMGRRAIHDEASALLRERLNGTVGVDMDTARRLFTLLCALHWRG